MIWRRRKPWVVEVTFHWPDEPSWSRCSTVVFAVSKAQAAATAIRAAQHGVETGWQTVEVAPRPWGG